MARPLRIEFDGAWYHVMNRGAGRRRIFLSTKHRAMFLIDEESHFCAVSRYIHLNPVDAGIVARPEAYPYSSYRALLGLERGPSWLFTGETLRRFGPGDARRNYQRFVESGVDTETRDFYADTRLRPVLGSAGFLERIKHLVRASRASSDPERPDCARLEVRLSLDDITKAVCRAFEVSREDLRMTHGPHRRIASCARGALVLLGREIGGESLKRLAEWVGYRSCAGASSAMRRMRVKAGRSLEIRDRLDKVRRALVPGYRPSSEGETDEHES